MKVSAIITCAGSGTRAGFDKNKLLVPFNGKTVLDRTVENFIKCDRINEIIITASKEDFDFISSTYPELKVVLGGKTRTDSVKNALKIVKSDIVVIHDGARPFVTQNVIIDSIESAIKFGSGIVAVPSSDTVARFYNDEIKEYMGKAELLDIQTPQTFNTEKIKTAYKETTQTFNDDGEVYKNYYGDLHFVLGSKNNVKLTFKEDFERLFTIGEYHFGSGFDCHKLVENRKLILGGVEIPHNKGLLGHSDADVLTHAIMDALLSACAKRDIGYYFPDTDEKYKDINSIKLLKEVISMLEKDGYKIKSVSATIMAEKPKLKNHIPSIVKNLAKVLKLDIENVGIGATTLEGLGFVGREEGICVFSTATLVK